MDRELAFYFVSFFFGNFFRASRLKEFKLCFESVLTSTDLEDKRDITAAPTKKPTTACSMWSLKFLLLVNNMAAFVYWFKVYPFYFTTPLPP